MINPKPTVGTTFQSVLGSVISAIRTSKDPSITQTDIANYVGLNVSTWSRIERGESPLTLEQLVGVALLLDFPLSKLFETVEHQIQLLGEQGVEVAVAKGTLEKNATLKLSTAQLIGLGMAAFPFSSLLAPGLALGVYHALKKK